MGTSLISLFENNKDIDKLRVFLLGDHVSDQSKQILNSIGHKYQREIYIIDVPALNIPNVLISKRWPISAFTRLFSAELLPNSIDKVLYIDCDTIVKRSIKKLYKTDMGENIFCGVKDCIGSTYKKNIGMPGEAQYINAGVLLINLNKLRNIEVSTLLESYLKNYTHFITYADQDLLNGSFSGFIGNLKSEYNVMTIASVFTYDEIALLRKPTNYYSKKEMIKAINEPTIIHYTTNMLIIRPWYKNSNHPFSKDFQKYFSISPWSNREMKNYFFKTKESKVIKIIQLLPKTFSYRLLGLIHAELRPRYIKIKASFKV